MNATTLQRLGLFCLSRLCRMWLLLICSIVFCQGCKKDWKADTYPARGRIVINGEPATGAIVELRSQGKQADVRNSRPWGIVKEDGSYQLTTYRNGDGAPAGVYSVTIVWPEDVHSPNSIDRLRGAFATPEKSQWNVTVSEKKNDLPPIEVMNVKVLPLKPSSGKHQ